MCAFDDPWEWELVDVGAMCESHSLFIEDEYTSMWRPEYDHDGDEIRSYNCDEIQKKIDTLSVFEIRKHCPFIPRTFAATFNCPQQKKKWDTYLFVTRAGAVRTNLVETVWHSMLKFRKKDSNIGGDRYCMLTNLAAAYFNQPYIQQWKPDYCMQARFAELLGVPVPEHTRERWDAMNAKRMKDLIQRHTEKHRIKVAKQKREGGDNEKRQMLGMQRSTRRATRVATTSETQS